MLVGINAPGEIRVGSLDSKETQLVREGDSRALYASTGHLLFVREGALLAQKFDLASKRVSGQPQAIGSDLLYFRDLGQADFLGVEQRCTRISSRVDTIASRVARS
jgi:hypothetical protein